ncbi:MAG: glycosyltransferase family 39 protein [Chloroflexi bacterium]|nr:glycosyltransferase family 39 protein [Chloroflexota bacterium]
MRASLTSRAGSRVGVVGVLVLLALAVPSRLLNLDAFAGKFDEGIRGTQLMLMAAGYRPFREIFASQGPLSLDIFYPTYLLFGQTLGAARLAPALFSVVGILVAAWTARHAGGLVAGAVAGLLLTVSPIFLKNSRLALVEVPALVPAMAAVGCALAYGRGGRQWWLAGAGLLMAVSLTIKPMAAPALVPVGLAILLGDVRRPRQWLLGGLLFGAVLAAVLAVIVLAVGPQGVYDQMIRFRVASRAVEGWSLKENWAAISGEMADEGLVLPALAGAAGLLLLVTRWRLGLPLVSWAVTSLGLLLVYSPLQFKHAVILLPPLTLLVGVGAAAAWRIWEERQPGARLPWIVAAGVVALGGWYAISLPRILELDRRLVVGMPETRPESFDDEIRLLSTLTGPNDFVIVDEPAVAFQARRLVPPNLVDTSMVRIRSRSLDADDVVRAARQSDVRVLFLFSDGLRNLKPFAAWVDEEFVTIKINERRNGKDRAVYLRRDADLDGARAQLERTLDRPSGATFGGELRLLGYATERGEARPGGSLTLTLAWQALQAPGVDYSIVTMLKDRTGQPVEQNQRGLGGGGEGTSAWEAGRWVFRTSTLAIKERTPPGEYTLAIGVYDSKARKLLPVDGAAPGEETVTLGTVQVRP